jgi:hypothetical protein
MRHHIDVTRHCRIEALNSTRNHSSVKLVDRSDSELALIDDGHLSETHSFFKRDCNLYVATVAVL